MFLTFNYRRKVLEILSNVFSQTSPIPFLVFVALLLSFWDNADGSQEITSTVIKTNTLGEVQDVNGNEWYRKRKRKKPPDRPPDFFLEQGMCRQSHIEFEQLQYKI